MVNFDRLRIGDLVHVRRTVDKSAGRSVYAEMIFVYCGTYHDGSYQQYVLPGIEGNDWMTQPYRDSFSKLPGFIYKEHSTLLKHVQKHGKVVPT